MRENLEEDDEKEMSGVDGPNSFDATGEPLPLSTSSASALISFSVPSSLLDHMEGTSVGKGPGEKTEEILEANGEGVTPTRSSASKCSSTTRNASLLVLAGSAVPPLLVILFIDAGGYEVLESFMLPLSSDEERPGEKEGERRRETPEEDEDEEKPGREGSAYKAGV